jgi:hypothetical protein
MAIWLDLARFGSIWLMKRIMDMLTEMGIGPLQAAGFQPAW